MALEEYRRKRDFRRTPEPPGEPPASIPAPVASPRVGEAGTSASFPGWDRLPVGRRFCVQMHHASRLHWDLRLELDGVLLSWAVPRGPTLDPVQRRLAVHVEDHPTAYGDFEGVIPDGYGAGTVMLWDAGTVRWVRESAADPGASLARGDLKFALDGVKLRGEFALVRTGGPGSRPRRGHPPAAPAGPDAERQWLLIKKRDPASVPGFDAADLDVSVRTGRSLGEIAAAAPAASPPGPAPRAPDDPRSVVAAAPRRRVPSTLRPMLAGAVGEAFTRPGWLFEMKYDGVRAIATVQGGAVSLRSRNGRDETRRYPELRALAGALALDEAVVDGEIVTLDAEGRPSFELLQRRVNLSDLRQVEHVRAEVPAVLMAFDLIAADGHDLRDLPLAERKRLLRAFLTDTAGVRFADHVEAEGEALFREVAVRGVEGVVAKDAASRYQAGRRGGAWLKIRAWRSQDCAVCGFTEGRGGRGALGALVLGVVEDGRLVPCGRVGSGLDGDAIRDLLLRLEALRIDECPFESRPDTDTPATWVRPEVVCSVRHIGWTEAGTLRHPTFRGLRHDLGVADCVREPEIAPEQALGRTPPAEVSPRRAPAGGGGDPAAPPRATDRGRAGLVASHAAILGSLRAVGAEGVWEHAGRRLRLTNLDKPIWSDPVITKRELIAYYAALAPVLLPHLRDRPVGMQVFPDGIEGKHFWRKRIPEHAPDWVRTWTYTGDRTVTHVLVEEPATLVWMANGAVVDIHPWHSRIDDPERPDWAVFDLDPFPPATFADVVEVAQLVHAALDHYSLGGLAKTSGQTGLQIYVPVERGPDQGSVRRWVEEVARAIGRTVPERISFDWAVARRAGRLRIDYTQNVVGKTLAAPYSVRPARGAPVSTPLAWEELGGDDLRPDGWSIATILERVDRLGDLFAPVLDGGQRLPGDPGQSPPGDPPS